MIDDYIIGVAYKDGIIGQTLREGVGVRVKKDHYTLLPILYRDQRVYMKNDQYENVHEAMKGLSDALRQRLARS